jgi:hypothetical protein
MCLAPSRSHPIFESFVAYVSGNWLPRLHFWQSERRRRNVSWAIEGFDAKPTFGQRRIARRKKKRAPCAPAPRILDPTRPLARDVTGM